MTLTCVANQLYDLSVNGTFNDEHFTRKQFVSNVKRWTQDIEHHAIPNHHVMTITMADGEWCFYIIKLDNGEYDYWIPDTREQSNALWNAVCEAHRSKAK